RMEVDERVVAGGVLVGRCRLLGGGGAVDRGMGANGGLAGGGGAHGLVVIGPREPGAGELRGGRRDRGRVHATGALSLTVGAAAAAGAARQSAVRAQTASATSARLKAGPRVHTPPCPCRGRG